MFLILLFRYIMSPWKWNRTSPEYVPVEDRRDASDGGTVLHAVCAGVRYQTGLHGNGVWEGAMDSDSELENSWVRNCLQPF